MDDVDRVQGREESFIRKRESFTPAGFILHVDGLRRSDYMFQVMERVGDKLVAMKSKGTRILVLQVDGVDYGVGGALSIPAWKETIKNALFSGTP